MTRKNLKVANEVERVRRRTRCMAGPDGSSLLCGACGAIHYVQIHDSPLHVACPSCRYVHQWCPENVACACPSHNDPGGCGSELCWKRRAGL